MRRRRGRRGSFRRKRSSFRRGRRSRGTLNKRVGFRL